MKTPSCQSAPPLSARRCVERAVNDKLPLLVTHKIERDIAYLQMLRSKKPDTMDFAAEGVHRRRDA